MNTPYGLPIVDNCLICKLRTEGFFCDLPKSSLQDFQAIRFATSYPEGAVLFVEGQESRGVFMICAGRVKLTTTSREGKTLILRISGPGELLGLQATVSGRAYELTAETLQPCQLDFVRRDDFVKFLETHADACMKAARQLTQNVKSAYEMIRSLGLSHSIGERVARLLLEWAHDGDMTKDGIRIKISLTHEEIAQLIGTSRETVTRVLGEFKEKKLAELHGSTLLIRDLAGLEKLVAA